MFKKLLLAAVLLAAPLGVWSQQQFINCATSTACNPTSGPSGTGTGDPWWKVGGKINANDQQLYSMWGATGLLVGHGSVPNAPTAAAYTDVLGLWTGCTASNYLRGDGTCNNPGLTAIATNSVLCNGSGTTAVPVACSLGAGLVATPSGLAASQGSRAVTGTTDTILTTDGGKFITYGSSSATAVALAQAGSTGFGTAFAFDVENIGSGTVTITPSVSAINGASSLAIPANRGCTLYSDGSNWQVYACTALVSGGGSSNWSSLVPGTNTSGAFLIGSGASLGPTGTGTVNANQVNGATPPVSASLVGTNSSGQMTSVAVGGNLILVGGTLSFSQQLNKQTGTSYTIQASDFGKRVSSNNASSVAWTVPVATTTGFGSGFAFDVENDGAGLLTITPTTSTINGTTSLSVAQNTGCTINSDGTNYLVSACTALTTSGNVSNNGTPTSNQLAQWVDATHIKGVTANSLQLAKLLATTQMTVSGTGCTPTVGANSGAFVGTITLGAGPCTQIVITPNGATGITGAHGFTARLNDLTAVAAGTYQPVFGESTSSGTTVTVPLPAGVRNASEVLSVVMDVY